MDSTHAEAFNEDSTKMKAAMKESTCVEFSPEEESSTTPEVAAVKSTVLETVTEAAAMEVAVVERDPDEEKKFGEVEPSGNDTGVIVCSNLGLKPHSKLKSLSGPKIEKCENLVDRIQ